jgi:hypothetical protein
MYEFANLRPAFPRSKSIRRRRPRIFVCPSAAVWEITVDPLAKFILTFRFPLSAPSPASFFADKDCYGKYDPQKDEPIEGALVRVENRQAVSDRRGAYILRDLPAGK